MTTQFFHNKLGRIHLQQLDPGDHPKAALSLLASYKADVFMGRVTVQEFNSADGPLYWFDYNFKPPVELNKRDENDGCKLLVMVAGTMSIQVNASIKYQLSEGKLCLFRSTDYLVSLPEKAQAQYFLYDIDPVVQKMGWPGFTEGMYDCSPFMHLHLADIRKPPTPLPLPVDWLSLQLANLLFQLRLVMDRNQQDTKKDPYLELALATDAFIQQNFTQKYTLLTIAKAVGTNECTLKTAYNLHFKTTMNTRKINLRNKMAMEELLRSNKPIREIRMDCGYESETNFRENFQQETDLTPNAWRKKFKT